MPHFAFGIGRADRSVVIVEEDFATRGNHDHGARRHSFDLHNALHLLFLVLARKDGEADEELVEDAPERPHVDCRRVLDAHHDFGGTVEPTLNVRVELFILVCATSEINHLDSTLVTLAQQDVFGFHVTMDDVELFHIVKGDEQLDGKAANEPFRDALEVVHFDEFVEVHAEDLKCQNQVLSEDQRLHDLHDVFLVFRVMFLQLF